MSRVLANLVKNTKPVMVKMANYIGLMSGTSMDGVDGVVVKKDCKTVIASVYLPYSKTLKTKLKKLPSALKKLVSFP